MPYSYSLELEDFQAAQRLHLRHNRRARFWFIVWQRIVPVISVVALFLLTRDVTFHHFSYPPWLGGLLAGTAFFGLYCVAMRPLLIRRSFRSARTELGDHPHPVELDFQGGKLISRVPGRSEGRFERAAIVDFAENDRIVLLYLSKKKFLYIPKSALTSQAWRELREWLV